MNMSIIAASRLRQKPIFVNTFIGGVGDLYPDNVTFYNDVFSSSLCVVASDLQNYEVDSNNNIRFYIEKDYFLGIAKLPNTGLTYYLDIEGYCVDMQNNLQNNPLNLAFFPQLNFIENFSLRSLSSAIMAFPKATGIGSTNGDDNVFSTTTFGELTIDISRQSNNGGNPDGDIQELISNGGSVVYVDNSDPNQTTKPNAVTDLSATIIGGTYVELGFTQPTHVNNLKYALVFVDGFFNVIYDINDVYAVNLEELASYNIKIIIADEYFNISNYSNTINVTTTTSFNISQNTIGGTYVLLDENYIAPNETKTVDVYVDGILNNTITNASKRDVYAINLDELTNYDIYLVIEGNQSNTINVTTTTIDTNALFQNAVAYYKLDETSGQAIDVVNGFNGTLVGGVTQGVTGKIGNAYSFTNGRIDLPTSIYNDFDITNYTLSFWFKLDNISGVKVLCGQNASNVNKRNLFVLQNNNILSIQVEDNGTRENILTSTLIANQWYFLQVKSDFNNDFEVKLNNISQGLYTYVNPTDYQDQISFGNRFVSSSLPFEGELDEVSFINGQTTEGQDSDLYNNGNGITY